MDRQARRNHLSPALLLDQDTYQLVQNLVTAALLECCSAQEFEKLKNTDLLITVTEQAGEDLTAFAMKDPAAGRDPAFIARTYSSYSAVLHYRIAHFLYKSGGHEDVMAQSLPAMISRRGKLMSGAEIHFKSEIGERFIMDHGVGTVVGETAIIGDDCYILGGVTLGARCIDSNPSGQRHPRIGNRVQIGAFTSVLGNVQVGDEVFIGPGCIVTSDIPAGARVKVKTSLQISLAGQTEGGAHA